MRKTKQPNRGTVQSVVLAVFGAISLWAICATTIIVTKAQPARLSSVKLNPAVTTHPTPPGQCPGGASVTNVGPPASATLCQKAPDNTKRVIAYGVLADGTEAFIYEPTDACRSTRLPGSGAESGSSHGQSVNANPAYPTDQWRPSTYGSQHVAENGSYYGQISENTGRPKTVHVNGYYRNDGTYVRSHYRSPPRR